MPRRIGILSLQGDFAEHLAAFAELDCQAELVKKPEQVLECEALIEAQPRAGYFVRASQSAALPAASEPDLATMPRAAQFVGIHSVISTIVSQYQRYPDAFNLGGATASSDLYPTDALQKAALRALRRRPMMSSAPTWMPASSARRAMIARNAGSP